MTEVCLKWDILQENWGTSGEKRAKSDRGAPEMGCFAGKLGDLGQKGQKVTEVYPKWDVLRENWGTSGMKWTKNGRGVHEGGIEMQEGRLFS